MMATEKIERFEKIEDLSNKNDNKHLFAEVSIKNDCEKYGLPLTEVYKLAYNFYKGKTFPKTFRV